MDLDNPGDYNQAVMEYGALQCKPKSPICTNCELMVNCTAFQLQKVDHLPVKLKKVKVKNRFFNYIVLLDPNKTLIEERINKDIWQHLYQFPLIESKESLTLEELIKKEAFLNLISGKTYDIRLFNAKVEVHKLSHQHIYAKFWI